jgi:glycerol-3-phosphate dehydrogenase (NAD(P)+)
MSTPGSPHHSIRTVGVAGAGSWGTALALAAARAGQNVIVWAREPEVVSAVAASRENQPFLPGHVWPDTMSATNSLADLAAADVVLLAAPAQALRTVSQSLSSVLEVSTPVLICAKGMERRTGLLMSEVAAQELPGTPVGLLSGPSFATDVARGLPTAITLALPDPDLGRELAKALGSPGFRPYFTDDVAGVSVGGAVKNVLAIACGIVEGKGLGDSARAALTARGFAEMVRFGGAIGARPETLTGLSGLGDLILTCNSRQSRNFTLGMALASGNVRSGDADPLAEGAETAGALTDRAQTMGIDMPIAAAVAAILDGALTVDAAIQQLLARPLRLEV